MELRERLQVAVKEAMKAKLPERLSTLRMVSSAIKDREIAARGEGTAVGENDILTLLGKMVKQRQDSITAFEAGGRTELAAQERGEMEVIQSYMPKQMTDDEAKAAVASVIAAVGAASVKDMGKVMAELKSRFAGQMDMGKVGGIVKSLLG